MHATLAKFGFPQNEVASTAHWSVLLRPQQVTLGSLVLASKTDASAFSALPTLAYAELATATRMIEKGLRRFRLFDRINYLMLMMVDPHVHMHVLPRYATAPRFHDREIADVAWPGPPDLKGAVQFSTFEFEALREEVSVAMKIEA
jgi:diadenosine tetraphosphate (Ap4A) HIT family hydrolase